MYLLQNLGQHEMLVLVLLLLGTILGKESIVIPKVDVQSETTWNSHAISSELPLRAYPSNMEYLGLRVVSVDLLFYIKETFGLVYSQYSYEICILWFMIRQCKKEIILNLFEGNFFKFFIDFDNGYTVQQKSLIITFIHNTVTTIKHTFLHSQKSQSSDNQGITSHNNTTTRVILKLRMHLQESTTESVIFNFVIYIAYSSSAPEQPQLKA